jgi:hypothetical protein
VVLATDPDIALVSLRGGALRGCAEVIDGRIVANPCADGSSIVLSRTVADVAHLGRFEAPQAAALWRAPRDGFATPARTRQPVRPIVGRLAGVIACPRVDVTCVSTYAGARGDGECWKC